MCKLLSYALPALALFVISCNTDHAAELPVIKKAEIRLN